MVLSSQYIQNLHMISTQYMPEYPHHLKEKDGEMWHVNMHNICRLHESLQKKVHMATKMEKMDMKKAGKLSFIYHVQ